MDVNDLRVAVTVLGFVCFLAICFWAYGKRARKGFDEAAMLPFTEDEDLPGARADGHLKQGNQHG